jgi:hypothetical protein
VQLIPDAGRYQAAIAVHPVSVQQSTGEPGLLDLHHLEHAGVYQLLVDQVGVEGVRDALIIGLNAANEVALC